ncbi:MAG: hypothetical protein AAFN18_15265 [Cyanobacteria bacterium J06554_6]
MRSQLLKTTLFAVLLPLNLSCATVPEIDIPEADQPDLGQTIDDGAELDPSNNGEALSDVVVDLPPNLVDQSEALDPVAIDQPPETVSERIRQRMAADLGVSVSTINIERFSRETWSDGCLGLGGPAESCLAALTEGWQIEAAHYETQTRTFYRTDLTGDQIRQSNQAQNLPPSLQERLFNLTSEQFEANVETLTVTDSSPALWNGCMGVEPPETMCTQIGIFGWRATVSDGQQQWICHTDNLGNDIRLKQTK